MRGGGAPNRLHRAPVGGTMASVAASGSRPCAGTGTLRGRDGGAGPARAGRRRSRIHDSGRGTMRTFVLVLTLMAVSIGWGTPSGEDAGAPPPAAPTEEECKEAGGLWNPCGQLLECYFFPELPCPEVCVPQCQCGGLVGFRCPEGYACLQPPWCCDFFGVCVPIDQDRDGDTVPDWSDNCPWIFNPDQGDENKDGLGDACVPLRRGDAVPDGKFNLADAIAILLYHFLPEAVRIPLPCPDAADIDDSGKIELSDIIRLLRCIFAERDLCPSFGCYFDQTPDELPPCEYPIGLCP